jgi:N-acetylmuramoyl-L-alanine amidase
LVVPPTSPERLKRHVLREAVRDNVDVLRGRPPRSLRRGHHAWRAALHTALLAVVPGTALVVWSVVAGGGPDLPALSPGLALSPGRATFPAPRPLAPVTGALAVRKIVVDPGHGGTDSGARGPGDVWEKDVTLAIARELASLLEEATYDVVMTRRGDAFVSLRERARFANTARGDLFLSIHVNSVTSQDCHAVETYYLGPADDPRAERIASAENRDSGYQLADFRRLLEGVYVHVQQSESRLLAQAVQQELVSVLGNTNPAIRDKGVRSAPFLVLVATESPGILAEVSCMSNEAEAARLADPAHRQRIARALFLGVHAYAEARNRTATLGRVPGPHQGASR